MTLTIELTPTQEAKLEAAARESGTAPEELVKRLVEDDLSPTIAFHNPMNGSLTSDAVSDNIQNDHIEELRGTLNAIPEARHLEMMDEFLLAAQSGNSPRLLDTVLRWAEIGSINRQSTSVHPLAQFAGAFAEDPIFAQVKQAISENRLRDKTE